MKTKTKTTTRRTSGAILKLAKALGYSPRHTSSLIQKGMPDKLAGARAWLTARENDDSAASLRRERIGLVRAQRERTENENAVARKELISRTEVDDRDRRIGYACAAAFRALESEIPQLCLGLPLARSRPLVKTKIREIQAGLANGHDLTYWPIDLPPSPTE